MSEPFISWNAYPALLAAFCFAAGVCVEEWLHSPPMMWPVLVIVAALIALSQIRRRDGDLLAADDVLLTVAALIAVVAVGGLRMATFDAVPSDHVIRNGFGQRTAVAGVVSEASGASGGTIRFVLAVRDDDGARRGLLQITARSVRHEVEACDLLRVVGDLQPLPRSRNPGDFDYGRYLRRRQIYARMFVSGEDIVRLGRSEGGIRCHAVAARSAIARRIDRYVQTDDARAVMRALILGDRRAIAPEVRNRFARTGLLHLLAVSGLHVMIVGMILYRLLGPALMRARLTWRTVERIRSSTTGALLLGYMLVTGGSPSVVRAVVMTLLFMGAGTSQRTSHSFNTLGAASLLILGMHPVHLFEPGFQLSIAAVGAIIGLTPQLAAWTPAPSSKAGRHVHSGLTVTTAATIGTFPVVLAHFGQAAFGGLILNLPAVPITTAALSSGIAAVTIGEISASVGATLGASTDVLARLLLVVSELGDRYVGWSLVRWNVAHPAPIVAIILSILAVGRWRHAAHRWPLLIASIAVLTVHLWADLGRRTWTPSLDVIFLDVGQGDAALAILPNKKVLLVDAGPRSIYTDAGARIILPQLEHLGLRRIDTVVITHPDSDHLGGLPALMRSVPIGRVVRSGFEHGSNLFTETNHLIDSLGIVEQVASAGDTLALAPSVRAYVLHPNGSGADSSPNAHSVVLRLQYGHTGILLTGDAPVDAELQMVRAYRAMLRSDVLKVGHHGSRTSSAPAFLANVVSENGSMAVVSVAARNRFGLPDEDVLGRLDRTGFDVRTTASNGAVWIRSDGKRVQLVDW